MLSDFPVVWQEVVEPVNGMGAEPVEDVAEVGERVDLMSFTCDDEAGKDGGGLPSVIAAEKEPPGPGLKGDAGVR